MTKSRMSGTAPVTQVNLSGVLLCVPTVAWGMTEYQPGTCNIGRDGQRRRGVVATGRPDRLLLAYATGLAVLVTAVAYVAGTLV